MADRGQLRGVGEAMFPEDTLAGKPVDCWRDDPGISIGSQETGSESIDDDNDGTWHRSGQHLSKDKRTV